MEWPQSILQGASAAFDRAGGGPAAIPLAFLLGLLSAIVSVCCTLPVLSIVVGYAGTRPDRKTGARVLTAGFFALGAALALVILGAVAAAVGQAAQSTLGRYWKLFAGILAIFLGLGALDLLPFNPLRSFRRMRVNPATAGRLGALAFGIVGGGAVAVCSLACNPGIFIILGAAVLQGFTLWMAGILVAFALGFSLPLGALLLGVSLAAGVVKFQRLEAVVRRAAGVVLIAVGFYFLGTF